MNSPESARWARIQELFDTAITWPPAERALRLESLEAGPEVRLEVLALLAASDAEEEASRRVDLLPTTVLPAAIGPYRIVSLAGTGGRGRVYEAEREAGNGTQRVALKVMRDHLVSPPDLERFRREQQVLAALDHPGIARFIDSGWDPAVGPYLAMEWVDGVPVDEYCRRQGVRREARIRLGIDLLEALHAAHRRLVVHLDIKPTNVLVDHEGRLRILDFGTAKLLESDRATVTLQLTPRYTSPDQLRGEPVTTACDIYSAGLLVHELVTGRLPWPESDNLAALAERAAGTLAMRIETGDRDLDAVLAKALRFEPGARYPSAGEFAADLESVLERRPVSARPPTIAYQLGRLIARHRLAAALGFALLLTGVMGGLAATRLQQERLREAARSREIATFLRSMITNSAVATSGRPDLTVSEMIDRGNRRVMEGRLPEDVAASLQVDFAYFLRERGNEDRAEPIAREAIARADRSGRPDVRLQARSTLAGILIRRGRCAEAGQLLQAADGLLPRADNSIPAAARADYLLTRAVASEVCEANVQQAIQQIESAISLAAGLPASEFLVAPAVYRAGAQLQYALLLSRAGRTAEALRAISAGLDLAASHSDGRYLQVALRRVRSQTYSAAGDTANALADAQEAVRLSPGVVNPFEELRLQTLLAGRTADHGDAATARSLAQRAVSAVQARAAEVGPSAWMIFADAAEVMAKTAACRDAIELYQQVDALTGREMPRTWRGNRLFYEATCAAPGSPVRAARLARQALSVYGPLLPTASRRRIRLNELAALAPEER